VTHSAAALPDESDGIDVAGACEADDAPAAPSPGRLPRDDSSLELPELLNEVRRIEVQSRRLVSGVMAGGYASVFRGAGVEFDEVREFAEGDDPRSIDWNVTARTGRPFVKKYVDERELTLLFLLDLSPSMEGGFGPLSPRQVAARVCACLALAAMNHHDKVGLVAFGERVRRYVPPAKGLGHALRIVRDCLALRCDDARTRLVPALNLAARIVRRRAIVFLISDFLADGWQEAMRRCARRQDLVAVRLLAPELSPPEWGLMRVRDPESGRETVVDWSDERTRASYAGCVAAWRARVEEELRRAQVDRMDVVVPRVAGRDFVARALLDFFRMRELKGLKR
jgi:uncharacterized protein (DUF58 family)